MNIKETEEIKLKLTERSIFELVETAERVSDELEENELGTPSYRGDAINYLLESYERESKAKNDYTVKDFLVYLTFEKEPEVIEKGKK